MSRKASILLALVILFFAFLLVPVLVEAARMAFQNWMELFR